jgi:hypothetical protein
MDWIYMKHKAALGPLVVAALMLSAMGAHADAPDDAFLQAMQNKGLAQYFSSPANQISEAQRVCTDLRKGSDANAIAFIIGRDHKINNKGLEDSFINTSVDFYCPDVPHPQF